MIELLAVLIPITGGLTFVVGYMLGRTREERRLHARSEVGLRDLARSSLLDFDRTPQQTLVDCNCTREMECSVWFGPCQDGLNHRNDCPVARRAMATAKWPCGMPRYPELAQERLP